MRRVIGILTMTILGSCLFAGIAYADGTFEYEVLNDGTISVTGYEGTGDMNIPEVIDGFTVSAISDKAFDYDSFDRVMIPGTVKTIGEGAFFHSTVETELSLPDNVAIDDDAFRGASLPETVIIQADSIVGKNAFAYSSGIKSLTISQGVTINQEGFFHAEDLDQIFISSGITIEDDAFRGCSDIEDISPIDGNESQYETSFGKDAFAYCTSMKNVRLPKATSLAKEAFYHTKIRETLEFEGTIIFGKDSFRGSDLPETIIIPANSSIDKDAFAYTEGIEELTVGENVQIGEEGFFHTSDLEKLYIMQGTTVGKDAFRGCPVEELNIAGNCILEDGAFAYTSDLEIANIAEGTVYSDEVFAGSRPAFGTEVNIPEQPNTLSKENDEQITTESVTSEAIPEEENVLTTEQAVISNLSEAESLEDICNYIETITENFSNNTETNTSATLEIASSYPEYVNNYQAIKGYYTAMEQEAQSYYDLLKESAVAYYGKILNTINLEDYSAWNDAMDDFYDAWNDGMSDYYDAWNDSYGDMYDGLDDVIGEGYEVAEYSEVSDTWSTMYEDYSAGWSTMYEKYSMTWSYLYTLHSDVWGGLYNGNVDLDASVKLAEKELEQESDDNNSESGDEVQEIEDITLSDQNMEDDNTVEIADTTDSVDTEIDYSSPEIVQSVQEALNAMGYDCGTPDGIAGERTKNSISQYRAARRLGVGDAIDEALLDSLGILASSEVKLTEEIARAATVVAFTNRFATDVFTDDGSDYDTNKFHKYGDTNGYYLSEIEQGTWTENEDGTWHGEHLIMQAANYGFTFDVTADVAQDDQGYSVYNIAGTAPSYTDVSEIEEESDFELFFKVPAYLIDEASIMAEANNESVGGTNSNDVPPADIQEEETGQESDAVTPELKEFLDSYESFMNDYCDFMATYDSSDMTALIKYASLMESYAEFMDKADDYDTDDMSAD